jgi:NADH dehydrogenase
VYVAGDIASIYDYRRDRAVPASAQAGLAEASLVARNILRQAQQEPLLEFEPRLVGEALALGDDAVAEVAGVVVAGAAARTVKQAALWRYLYDLGGRSLVTDYR